MSDDETPEWCVMFCSSLSRTWRQTYRGNISRTTAVNPLTIRVNLIGRASLTWGYNYPTWSSDFHRKYYLLREPPRLFWWIFVENVWVLLEKKGSLNIIIFDDYCILIPPYNWILSLIKYVICCISYSSGKFFSRYFVTKMKRETCMSAVYYVELLFYESDFLVKNLIHSVICNAVFEWV